MRLLLRAATSLSTTDTSSSVVSVGHMAHEAEYLEPQLGLAAHSKLMLFESSEKWNRNLDYGASKSKETPIIMPLS